MNSNLKYKILIASPFIISFIYHLLTIVFPGFGEPSPFNRHLLFLFINSCMAFLALSGRKIFIYVLGVLLIQQVYSHGHALYYKWFDQSRVDYYSLVICLGLPIFFYLLIKSKIFK